MNPRKGSQADAMKQPSTKDDRAVRLLKALFNAGDAVFGEVAAILSEFELTQAQATMLWVLEPSGPPVPMRDLAHQLHCDPSNVTLLADQLQAKGLVERRPDPADGRRRILRLTEEGLEVWSLLIERIQKRSPVFTSLSTAEQGELIALLEKVATKQTTGTKRRQK